MGERNDLRARGGHVTLEERGYGEGPADSGRSIVTLVPSLVEAEVPQQAAADLRCEQGIDHPCAATV